jgi:hypothetical protein
MAGVKAPSMARPGHGEGSLTSWGELCRQFMTNFESVYARPGNEVYLHIMQQRSEESLQSFIQWFS